VLTTTVIARHLSAYGRFDVFGHTNMLRPGDLIVVHDTLSGFDVRFTVTDSVSYPLAQTPDPAVLTQIQRRRPGRRHRAQPSYWPSGAYSLAEARYARTTGVGALTVSTISADDTGDFITAVRASRSLR